MTAEDVLSACAGTSIEVDLRRQGGEHSSERTRHAPHMGTRPINAAARRTSSHRARKRACRRWHQRGHLTRGYIVDPRVAHETSPEQIVRCRQRELADDLRELIERRVNRDLDGLPWTELTEQPAIARQEHAALAVRKVHQRPVVG